MADLAGGSLAPEAGGLVRKRAAAGLVAFVFLLALLIFVVETLSQIGVPQSVLIWLTAVFALAVPAVAAISTRTVSLSAFAVADRQVTVSDNATASAVAMFGAVFAIGLGAAFFRSEAELSALVLGLCGGCLVGGVLFAPYLRRGAAQSPGSFLAARFGGSAVSGLCGVIVAAALFPMLVAQLSVAGMIGDLALGIGRTAPMIIVAVLVLLPPLLGGIRGLTAAAVLQFVLLFVALVATSAWVSAAATGSSFPLAGYAIAAANIEVLEAANAAIGSAAFTWNLAGAGFCVALGVSVFPALLIRSAAVPSAQSSRSSIAWTLFLLALFAVAIASISAAAKWMVIDSPARLGSIAELIAQPWVGDWIARDEGLIKLCGASAADAGATCINGVLKAGDLAIDPQIALLAASDIAGAPPLFSMLIATGCLVAAVAAGSLLAFGIGRALGHDVLFRTIMPRAPVSRRLLLERLLLVVSVILGVYVAADPPADYFRLALASLSISASGLFPVMLVAVWWGRANRFGAVAAMLAGFAVAAYFAAGEIYDPTLMAWLEPAGLTGVEGLADWARSLGIERAALIGVPAGVSVAVIVSLVTPAPEPARRAFAAALLSPRDMAPRDDTE